MRSTASPVGRVVGKLASILTHPHHHQWLGRCNICGQRTPFVSDGERWIRRCVWCRSTPKYRAIQYVVERRCGALRQFLDAHQVYELTTRSPIYRTYGAHPHYTVSGYFSDRPFGVQYGKVWNQDLQRLSFPDGSFDLLISSETMEHVRRPWVGFREIERVLKPGGCHVFTIPYGDDRITTPRVDTRGPEDVDLLPRVYHQDPYRPEDSLLYTDFGRDLPALLEPLGLRTEIERIFVPEHDIQDDLRPVVVFVSQRVSGSR